MQVTFHVLKLKKEQMRLANYRTKGLTFHLFLCEGLLVGTLDNDWSPEDSIFDCNMQTSFIFALWIVGSINCNNPNELLQLSLANTNTY